MMEISELKGKVLTSISGASNGGTEIIFNCDDGTKYKMYHRQDCCEHVIIDDVNGDVSDLIGSPLLIVEEVSNDEFTRSHEFNSYTPDSFTWTFYKLATKNGYVNIRWYGESNGYYSERVDFEQI